MWNEAFLILRIIYAIIILGVVIGVVIWSVRGGQFKDQEHAANLPHEIED